MFSRVPNIRFSYRGVCVWLRFWRYILFLDFTCMNFT